MPVDPALDQAILRQAARAFLQRECPPSVAREALRDEAPFPADLWAGMARLGWLGLGLPEQHGGAGSFVDLVVVCEELGRAVAPGPFLETVVLAGGVIAASGSEEQRARYLPPVVAGSLRMTLAAFEPGARHETDRIGMHAVRRGRAFWLTGTKTLVPHATCADAVVCVARTSSTSSGDAGLSMFVVEAGSPGLAITPLPTLGRDRRARLELDGVRVPVGSLLGPAGEAGPILRDVLRSATVALAAQMVGGADQVLEMTVEHARSRIQFGRPLAALQALQHRCADAAIRVDVARALVHDAAWRISTGRPAEIEASMAKATANEGYRQATWIGAELHGGTGFMDEHPLTLHYRTARAATLTLGDTAVHRERIAAGLLDHGPRERDAP